MKSKATWVALLSSLLGAGCLHLYLARYERDVAGGAAQPVVVVTRDLALGELITRAALDYRDLPERYVEERHVEGADLERVLGARATTAVRSGSSLLWSDLDVSQEGRTLSGLVRTGMRAFTLPERDLSFDGLLRPGDRVDVLFTRTDVGTRTLLQNVLVLTIGTDLGGDSEASAKRSGTAGRVTLSVSPEQAQRLAQSEGRGALRLALRNPQDLVSLETLPLIHDGELRASQVSETLTSRSGRGVP